MRGGLGRTLLSAFLLLTIVPLAAISFLAVKWARQDLRREIVSKLASIAQLKETEIEAWTTSLDLQLDALVENPNSRRVFLDSLLADPPGTYDQTLIKPTLETARNAGAFEEIGLFDTNGHVSAATNIPRLTRLARDVFSAPVLSSLTDSATGESMIVSRRPVQGDGATLEGYLIGLADLGTLNAIMTRQIRLGETGEAYLVSPEAIPLTALRFADDGVSHSEAMQTEAVQAALVGRQGAQVYVGYYGEPVIGAYRWLPALQIALIVEQAEQEAFAEDGLVALLIAAALAVALLTTMLAAVITRQLSRPIVQLTLSAVKIAGGDLEQTVPVERRDEIGILAQAFNVMTVELRSLYRDLEQKVAERTRQLREANQRLRYQAMQLTLSAEVGRAITFILDLDQLLQKVVELIRDSYRLLRVTIYLLDERGTNVVQQARSGWDGSHVSSDSMHAIHRESLVGQAATDGQSHMDVLRANMAIPLRIGQRVIGVLKLQAYHGDEFSEDDLSALQSLADQISVAIQNAQTYAVEKGTVDRLRRLDQMRTQSLSNMSRELATSLNSIIGFSRLILKGVDGPLTDQQRSDVGVINRSGQHLLGLLDDILELIDLESGSHPLRQTWVELEQIVANVIDKATPLAENKSIALRFECSAGLPRLQADGERLCLVLSHLLYNAIEAAQSNEVTVGACLARNGRDEIVVSVSSGPDTPWTRCDGNVEQSLYGFSDGDMALENSDSSIKMILSKRIIELHGGHLWVGGGQSQPAAFAFTLPLMGMAAHSRTDSQTGGQAEDMA